MCILAFAMTEIRDDGISWSVYVLLLYVCVILIVVIVFDLFSLYTLYGHLVLHVCHKMTVLEGFNQE